jgi:CAP-Gly domain
MATLTPRQRASYRNLVQGTPNSMSTPTMAKRGGGSSSGGGGGGDELEVGDKVEMQGMDGVVKFLGEIKGKPGFYVGVELNRRWAEMGRGKNSGDAGG